MSNDEIVQGKDHMAIEEENITDNRYVRRRDSHVDIGVGED